MKHDNKDMLYLLMCVTSAVLASSCALTHYNLATKSGSAPPAILSNRGTVANFGAATMWLYEIDGRRDPSGAFGRGGRFELVIDPGPHTLNVHYDLNPGPNIRVYSSPLLVSFVAEPGHSYLIKAEELVDNTWRPVIIDVTDKASSRRIDVTLRNAPSPNLEDLIGQPTGQILTQNKSVEGTPNKSVEGTVKGSGGTAIQGATVKVQWTDAMGQKAMNLKTDKSGHFMLMGLKPGAYKVTLEIPGSSDVSVRKRKSVPGGEWEFVYRPQRIQNPEGVLVEVNESDEYEVNFTAVSSK